MLVNGSADTRISATDRGLLYGDGLFETLLVAGGRPCLWTQHLARLARGCERLRLAMPAPSLLLAEARAVLGDVSSGVLKIILTRGPGGRGYGPDPDSRPTRIVQLFPPREYPAEWTETGVVARYCATRLGINPALAGIKHLNRLEQVLARAEWRAPEIAEGVMLDTEGRVIEGTMSNLFLVRDGCLITPTLDRSGVAGVMRELALDLARSLEIPVEVKDVRRDDVRRAEALFFTNSLFGIWAVRSLDGMAYDTGRIPGALRQGLLDLRLASGDKDIDKGFGGV